MPQSSNYIHDSRTSFTGSFISVLREGITELHEGYEMSSSSSSSESSSVSSASSASSVSSISSLSSSSVSSLSTSSESSQSYDCGCADWRCDFAWASTFPHLFLSGLTGKNTDDCRVWGEWTYSGGSQYLTVYKDSAGGSNNKIASGSLSAFVYGSIILSEINGSGVSGLCEWYWLDTSHPTTLHRPGEYYELVCDAIGRSSSSSSSPFEVGELSDFDPYLKAYWPLDETSGTRYDIVGDNDLTPEETFFLTPGEVASSQGAICDGAYFAGQNGNQLITSGSGSTLQPTSSIMISAWAKHLGGNWFNVVSKYGFYPPVSSPYWIKYTNVWFSQWEAAQAVGHSQYSLASFIDNDTINKWVHLCMITFYNVIRIYADGVFKDSRTAGSFLSSDAEVQIGSSVYSYTNHGLVDEVAIWIDPPISDSTTADSLASTLYNNGIGTRYDPSRPEGDKWIAPHQVTCPGHVNLSQYNQYIMGYWPMDELSEERYDVVGDNDLIEYNSVTPGVEARICNGAEFDSLNYGFLSTSPDPTIQPGSNDDYAFSFWWKADSSASRDLFWMGTLSTYRWRVWVHNGKFQWTFNPDQSYTPYDYTENSWNHFCITVSKGNPSHPYHIFWNGQSMGGAGGAMVDPAEANDVVLFGGGSHISGLVTIDEACYWQGLDLESTDSHQGFADALYNEGLGVKYYPSSGEWSSSFTCESSSS